MAHRFASGSGLASQELGGSNADNLFISVNTTLLASAMVFVSATAADVTVTLPAASECEKDVVRVKKVFGVYKVRIVPKGTDVVDGGSLLEITELMAAYTLYSDGATWHVM